MPFLRMEAKIKANGSIGHLCTESSYLLPTIGGFEMKTAKGNIYQFDFEDGDYYVDAENNIITCCLFNPDLDVFPEMENFIDNREFEQISDITEFIIDATIVPDNDLKFEVVSVCFICTDNEKNASFSVAEEVIRKNHICA